MLLAFLTICNNGSDVLPCCQRFLFEDDIWEPVSGFRFDRFLCLDTFASKTAAIEDETADASVGNVTGSNAVNVFLGTDRWEII